MLAGGADGGRFFADIDITAVAADPDRFFRALENEVILDVTGAVSKETEAHLEALPEIVRARVLPAD